MVESITLETTTELSEAAERKVEEIEIPLVITVAHPVRNLIAQHRMDGFGLLV